jgi:hypothetical protein
MNESFPLWSVPASQQSGLLVVAAVLAACSLIYALRRSFCERDLYPLYVFLGAGCAVLLEPIGDIFTQVVYPQVDQISAFSAWGREIPLWMIPNYLFFFCIPVLLLMRFLIRPGMRSRTWWLTYFSLAAFVAVFEMPGINARSWKYYGDPQLLNVNTYPVWVGFNNAQCLVSTAVAVYLLRRTIIHGTRSILLIALVPLIIAATHIAPSLPVATATHSTASSLWMNVAAVVTIALNVMMVWVGLMLIRSAETIRMRAFSESGGT